MKGDLPPYGDDGTQFVISLTTGSYGKAPVGTLVIDTEDMQGRYEVRGVLPKYETLVSGGRINNKSITTNVERRFKRVNHIRRNISTVGKLSQ